MSVPVNKLPNTKPNDPSTIPPAQPPQGKETEGGDDDGEGQETISLESLTPAQKALFDSEAAKIRRSNDTAIKKAVKEALDAKKQEDQLAAQKAAGNFEQLLQTEQTAHEQTKQELKRVAQDSLKMRAAMEAELPEAFVNYVRIIDSDDYETLLADANALKKSFAPVAHRDPNTPPATPDGKGGKSDVEQTLDEKKKISNEQIKSEVSGTKMYKRF
jgi:hypothetical protein